MFFGNKNLEDKVTLLLNEIEELKNQLLVKEQEKEEIKNDFSKQLEETAANNEKKVGESIELNGYSKLNFSNK